MALFGAVCLLVPQQQHSILEAANRSGLAMFLMANLMTGVVNLSIDTLSVGAAESFAILALYMLAVCAGSVALDKSLNRE